MKINLVGNLQEEKGLAADARLLRSYLEAWGHAAEDVYYEAEAPQADLNIFLETCPEHMHRSARVNVCIPNVEWLPVNAGTRLCDAVWAKTAHAMEVLKDYPAEYLGFTTEDVRRTVPRKRRFIHVAGGSRYRNTDVIVEAWRRFYRRGGPEITIIAANLPPVQAAGITWISRIASREDYLRLANSHLYHLMPSQYEGYGVALWEARSMGNVVITTDAAPMSEGEAFCRIPVDYFLTRAFSGVEWAVVSPENLWAAVTEAWEGSVEESRLRARANWAAERSKFGDRLRELLSIAMRVAA